MTDVKEVDLTLAVDAGDSDRDEPAATAASPARRGRAERVKSTTSARAASERRARISELMDAHGEAVFGFCMRMLRSQTLVDDVVQQVFLEAYRDLDRVTGPSARAWLFGIARHRCLDAARSQQRRSKVIENNEQAVLAFEDPGAGPIEHLDRVRLAARLEQCLQRLSPDVRATVLLRFQTGATYEQLAEQLAASADTLQIRVSRALPVLRRCLAKKGWTGE